ncbi:hypothetical protein GIB67_038383 [Kingdonia uniflora]|uniref:Uncharacterized protein n=1 Tax=Kingdonia uniflora TaxID=39325 RepID=A0A7J7NNZ0_9MAGN|nr:hypothetical protein GIB67_038383 [Kingdonia uniflora]
MAIRLFPHDLFYYVANIWLPSSISDIPNDIEISEEKQSITIYPQRLQYAVVSGLVYEYLVSGNCSSMLPVDNSGDLPMPLCSLHAFLGEEPLFTNCTPDFTNTLDYIFFAPSGRLKPLSCIELPGLKSPDVVGGLPNYYHPSDHLPIGCDFQVLEN